MPDVTRQMRARKEKVPIGNSIDSVVPKKNLKRKAISPRDSNILKSPISEPEDSNSNPDASDESRIHNHQLLTPQNIAAMKNKFEASFRRRYDKEDSADRR